MGSAEDRLSELVKLLNELIEESLFLPDEKFEEIMAELVNRCEVRPGAHKMAILFRDVARKTRSETLARLKASP